MADYRKKIEVDIDLITRDAQRRVKDLGRDVTDLADSTDEVTTAGQLMARAIEASADDMVAEINATRRAADALGRALGVDMSNAVDRANVDRMTADLKQAGLAAADVEADADALAAALRRVDDVKVTAAQAGFRDLGDAVGQVRDQQDRARGATNSFVGNAMSELPGVSDAFGPVGEAVSQMTEGILEGEIGLRQFAAAGAAMAVTTFVVKGIADHFADIAATRAFRREEVEDYTDALLDADDALGAIMSKLTEDNRIEFRLFDETFDLVPLLASAGVTVEQFGRAISEGREGLDRLRGAMESAGVGAGEIALIVGAAEDQVADLAAATERAAQITAVFGATAADAADSSADATAASEAAAAALTAEQQQRETLTDAVRDQIDQVSALYDAQLSAIDSTLGLASASDRTEDAVSKLDAMLGDGKSSLEDIDRASRNAESAALAQAAAAVRLAEDQAAANSETLTAADRNRIMVDTLNEVAAGLAPGSLLRGRLNGYIDDLRSVPTKVATVLDLNFVPRVDTSTLDGILRASAGTASTTVHNYFPPSVTPPAVSNATRTATDRNGRAI